MNSPDIRSCKLSDRVAHWRLRSRVLKFGDLPVLMGIVNVTPDSFSDGGSFYDHHRAVEHGLQLAADGAAILDVGGESTRPNAVPVSEEEELRRVVNVVQSLAEQTAVPISIDTSKANVASEAIAAGAEIINDVTGLEGDPNMVAVATRTQAGICAMHMRGTPRTMQSDEHLQYEDVVQDVFQYLTLRRQALLQVGISSDRICLDPGIGFAKTHQHSLALLRHMEIYHQIQAPILVGHSRKGFLAKILGNTERDRTQATVGVSLALATKGVQVVRVHDVREVHEALISFAAAGGIPARYSRN